MTCSVCFGRVQWMGPITALTHTECEECGSINAQLIEQDDNDNFETQETMTNESSSREVTRC